MDTASLDIVYFIKDSAYNDELKYSLRSVEQNFPHKRVVFYGGKPCGLIPDRHVQIVQRGKTKWDKVRAMYEMMAEDDDLTEDIVVFNDDFFVLHEVEKLPICLADHLDLPDLIFRIEGKNNDRSTGYTRNLRKTYAELKKRGFSVHSYELHVPMLFNREKLKGVLKMFQTVKGIRTLYGNTTHKFIPTVFMEDCKIVDDYAVPSPEDIFVSTSDLSFSRGRIGGYIRERFPNKSRFER